MIKPTFRILIGVALAMLLVVGAHAASIDHFYVTPSPGEDESAPGEGTSNSIFTIHFNWHDTENGKLPDANSLKLSVHVPYGADIEYTLPAGGGNPKGTPDSAEGALYEYQMTAGQNLIEEGSGAGYANPAHPIPDLRKVLYIPILVANASARGAANTITLQISAKYTPPDEDPSDDQHPATADIGPVEAQVIIHDSHLMPNQVDPHSSNRYAGVNHDRDFLYAYHYYHDGINTPLPIQSFALDENFQWRAPDDPSYGQTDNGTTSTAWEFRVVYRNSDNLPPIPYLNSWGGWIGDDYIGKRSGEDPSGVVLYLRNKSWPTNDEFIALPMQKVSSGNNNYAGGVEYVYYVEPQSINSFVGLPIGEYEWFIACSDDNIRTPTGDIPSYLDPQASRMSIYPDPIVGGINRNYQSDYGLLGDWSGYNTNLYLDRPTFQPGETNLYDWSAKLHPVISVGLKDGYVTPLYTVVDPTTGEVGPGGAENQKFNFEITYQHLYGVTPDQSQGAGGEISVWINNSANAIPNASDPDTQYKRYTMVRDPLNPLGTDVKKGILYRLPDDIQLKPGPHAFFFTASDGLKRVRYPVNGHHWEGQGGWHAFRGPYVNHRPVLENPVVDPPTGTAGDKFRYTVIYKDADGQRPYRARVYIEYAPGQVYVGEMIKENPADSDYKTGVKYIFDTANMAQQFQVGDRRFYFEFTDDWGAPSDPRDQRQGETVYWQSAQPESWIYGPFINRNTRPQLLGGSVNASDTANNSATLFEYRVKYLDKDNHEPKYIDVYIGQKQSDGTIAWDSGHRMDPVDPNDTVYGDGAWYKYSSRLSGLTPGGRDFYYCFAASDSYDPAEYDPVTSPSAGAVWMTWDTSDPENPQPVHKGERLAKQPDGTFHLSRLGATGDHPIVGPIPNAPTDNPYVSPIAWLTNGSGTGIQDIDYILGTVQLDPAVTVADFQYLFASAGPSDVVANNAPSLSSGRVSPDPGESTNEFTYSVVYSDPDGTTGQPPYYIRVVIDGVPHDMARTPGQANPDYRLGVTYYYRTTSLIPALPHYYYFEASDGSGYAIFDALGGRNTNIGAISRIAGPYVNDKPTLTAPQSGAVNPVPGQPMTVGDPMNFSIVYTDKNGEMPQSGYPVVYIRKVVSGEIPPVTAPEPEYDFKVVSVSGAEITVANTDDTDPNWRDDQFKGLPLQITSSGPAQLETYRITANTANKLTVFTTTGSIPNVSAGATFSIGKLILGADPGDTGGASDGLLHEFRLHSLGEGSYAVHFKSVTTETIGAGGLTRETTLHYPATGEISGISVVNDRPTNPVDVPPILTLGAVAPQSGRASDNFTFSVKYSDNDNDPPGAHDAVVGYMRLIIDDQTASPITMTGTGNYVTGVTFSATVAGSTLTPGSHTCYFEASDGWPPIVRFPATGTLPFTINRKPVLTGATVTPATGNAGTPYAFSVVVKDADGQAPPVGSVLLSLDGTTYPMTIDTSTGTDFVAGVTYTKTIHDPAIMTVGDHSYFMSVNDGLDAADTMDPITAPTVYANTAPTLSQPMVDPVSRFTDTVYTYSVKYTDANGDAPEYVNVYIDGTEHAMVKTVGQDDYTAGVTYTYAQQGLTEGADHTYYFTASDHLDTARNPASETYFGPTVAAKPGVTLTVNQPSTPPTIGHAVTLTGSISPAMAVPITLTFTRPDGSTFTKSAASIASSGAFSTSWTPDMTGAAPGPTWMVTASWIGNADYTGATSAPTYITVAGPSTTVRGLDMVSIPLDPAVSDPSVVFGLGSYALAQYMPQRNDYLYYRSSGQYSTDLPLSDIALGGGYWIKVYNDQTLSVAPSGDLASTVGNYIIPLKKGWNQIGCPFTTNVDWGTLRVQYGSRTLDIYSAAQAGWVRSYGWAFQQSATNPYTGAYKLIDPSRSGALRYMEPWRGYWFKALVDCNLIVPPPGLSMQSEVKTLSVKTLQAGPKAGWEVQLRAAVGDKSDADNAFGVSSRRISVESPSYLENYIDLSFTGENGAPCAYDLRPGAAIGEKWNFKVTTDQNDGLVEIAWTGLDTLPGGQKLMLEDLATGKSVEMTSGGVYTFPASAEGRSFRVTLGGK